MLDVLFDKHGCDKASKHNYHLVYEKDFHNIKNDQINILEIGIFKGDSIRAWLEYFPNAQIYGIDIFTRVSPEDIDILDNDRVHWIKGDSLSESITDQIRSAWGTIEFDIIIDDGKHTPEANTLSFANINQFLRHSGAYYIEDVWPLDIMTDAELKHQWIRKYSNEYTVEKMKKFLREIDSHAIERFDLRQNAQPDSYIIKIKGK